MKIRVFVSTTSAIVLSLTAYFLFFAGEAQKYQFRFDTMSKGDIQALVNATGTISAVTTVEVGTQVSGRIAQLYADFNSVVNEGDVIAQIDPTFLEQTVRDAEANLARAKAQHAESKRAYERASTLRARGLESEAFFDAAATALEARGAALKQSQANLERARVNLAYATIHAPISGVIIDRKVNVGQTVAASFSSPTLFTIANDLRKMQVQTTIDESDIGVVSIDQLATFTVEAFPDETFHGTVSQIRLAPKNVQNVVNYTVIINVDNDNLELMPGMTANVRLGVASATDVMRVPTLALRFQPPADLVDSSTVLAPQAPGLNDTASPADRLPVGVETLNSSGDQGQMDIAGQRVKMKREEDSRFEIEQRFPQYQKSSTALGVTTGRGRLWILNGRNLLEPLMVGTGLTDGRYTEIRSTARLKAGDQIVLGVSSTESSSSEQILNPLAPQNQRRMGGDHHH